MEIFIIMLVILAILGSMDLLVGVANDAVNFTNSAVGSKAAKTKYIMAIAGVGIIIGALSSGGMMEVARKGIFHPDGFTVLQLMYIFLAVMLSDIILLDLYNTLGLPTSTTVSLVFELLGSALVLALWKEGSYDKAIQLINTASAFRIIIGIVVSVVISFTVGVIVQFIVRFIFTFDYEKKMKIYGGVFSGVALTGITFFIFTKGLKGASFITSDIKAWVGDHNQILILGNFLFWTAIFQFLINRNFAVLKAIVLVGTGALAIAFAGNDLVNFIGVPLAGYNTFKIFSQSMDFSQSGAALAGNIPPENYLLLFAAIVMILTLFLSKKARTVTKTEVSLGSQEEAVELFSNANPIARSFVQIVVGIIDFLGNYIPKGIKAFVNARFNVDAANKRLTNRHFEDAEAFDLLRASVNIMAASILIMVGTSMKLPLSTTFVTFMVAMGTSLSDRAWGKDNAVARVSGVLAVIGGWFLTAVIASFTAGFVVTLLFFGGVYSLLGIVPFAIYLLFVFKKVHTKREEEYAEKLKELIQYKEHPEKAFEMIWGNVHSILQSVNDEMRDICKYYETGKAGKLNRIHQRMNRILNAHNPAIQHIIELANKHFDEKDLIYIPYMTKSYTDVKYVIENIRKITHTAYEKIMTYHTGLSKKEAEDIEEISKISQEIIKKLSVSLPETLKNADKIKNLIKKAHATREEISQSQIKRIKQKKSKANASISYLIILDEFGDLTENLDNLLDNIKKMKPLINKLI